MAIDLEAPLRFLRTAFQPDDWIAVLLKSHETGATAQRWAGLARGQRRVPGVVARPERQALQRVRQRERHPSAAKGANP
jgi:hypothetical protein